mgnify:CR=1 FL=1
MKKIILLLVLLISFNTLCNSQNKKQLSEREEDSLYIDYCARFVNNYMTYDEKISKTIRTKYPVIINSYYIKEKKCIDKIINIYLKYKGGVCDDFNKLFLSYLQREEIKELEIYDVIVRFEQYEGRVERHAATIIRFYENWYYFDTTWGLYWLKYIPHKITIGAALLIKGSNELNISDICQFFN